MISPFLSCNRYIASKVKPYLKMYQTDNPMIPYMYFDLKKRLKDLLEIIIEPEVIQIWNKAGKRLIEIDLESKLIKFI